MSSLPPQNPEPAKNSRVIKDRMHSAIQFLKKKSILLHGKNTPLRSLPWYLLIGASGAGKTTLLANSKIKFVLEKKLKADSSLPASSHHYDMWVTHNAVIFDVPGNYITHENKVVTAPKMWPAFLKTIRKFRGKNAISGIIVALSLSEIMDKQNRHALLDTLKHRMLELQARFGKQLPFYFTITKCDLLPGFLEFFGDYGSDELGQAWGVPLAMKEQNESFSHAFVSRFNELISRLNKQLITRLYQERNPGSKFLVKDFPLQLEKVKKEFAELLKVLTSKKETFDFRGVYLTSATQQQYTDKSADFTHVISTNQLQNTLTILQKPHLPVQTYFVKQFLLQGLAPMIHQKKMTVSHQRKIAYALIVSFIVTGIFFYTKDHQQISARTKIITVKATDNEPLGTISNK